jgi:CDP-glucose 4,6-dehydratase
MGIKNMNEILSSYKGKKVFITGHTGFKGSWLSYLMLQLGAEVRGYSLEMHTDPNHFGLLNLDTKIDHVLGDICNLSILEKSIIDFEPDYVFHLAAQAIVKDSYENPVKTFNSNIIGSVNLLESVKRCPSVRALIFITSDKCYENFEWVWGYRENDQLGGHDPYSASKGAAELVFSAYSRSFFSQRKNLGVASARAGNVIGGGDWAADRIIPDCIRAIIDSLPIKLRNPNATRPWQHVLEPIYGYVTLGAYLYSDPEVFSGSWNFGPSTSEVRTVFEVANDIIKYIGQGSIEIDNENKSIHEANLLQLNCDKAKQMLGWHSRWNAKKTISSTAKWYKVFIDGGDIESITKEQINDYLRRSND